MKRLALIGISASLLATTASAGDWGWELSKRSLNDYIGFGFAIVGFARTASSETYILQKGTFVARCTENASVHPHQFTCEELGDGDATPDSK
jgi:hypothetical protein